MEKKGLRLLVWMLLLAMPVAGQDKYIPTVELIERNDQWWVLRDGQTIKLHGASVPTQQLHLLNYLANKGGVVTRTWGTNNIGDYLDRAEQNGVGVIVGFWMGHERQGFDYADKKQVAEQLVKAKQAVRKYRDHPAVMMWSIGNEMESGAKNPDLVYHALSDLVAVVKDEDKRRPVITVVAEITKDKIEKLNRIVPWLDGLGINSYGGIRSLGKRVSEYGWKKPFIVTEYGPRGSRDSRKTEWNAPIEATSSQKAAQYGASFDAVALHDQCVGTVAFIYGWKPEATPTWYGIFLEDGSRLGAVDVLQQRWSGKPPNRRAPVIKSLVWPGDASAVEAGSRIELSADVVSREPDRLVFEWTLITETAFQTEKEVVDLSGFIAAEGPTATITVPSKVGAYRVSVIVRSRRRSAATANVAFRVRE